MVELDACILALARLQVRPCCLAVPGTFSSLLALTGMSAHREGRVKNGCRPSSRRFFLAYEE